MIAIDGVIMTEVLWGMGSGQVHLPFIVWHVRCWWSCLGARWRTVSSRVESWSGCGVMCICPQFNLFVHRASVYAFCTHTSERAPPPRPADALFLTSGWYNIRQRAISDNLISQSYTSHIRNCGNVTMLTKRMACLTIPSVLRRSLTIFISSHVTGIGASYVKIATSTMVYIHVKFHIIL